MDKERLAEVLRGLRSNRGSLSWFTKGVIAALLVMHLITYIPGGYNAMALAPGEVGPPSLHIWTFVTAPFTEKALIQVLLDIVAVFVCASMLEPLWGGFKLLEMIVVVGAAANLVTTLSYIALYAASSNPDLLFLPFSGFSAVVCGLAVAYKQSFPQATVQLGLLRVHTRHLPLALIAAHVAFYLLGTGSLAQVILSASGFLTAWVFLRFYQNRNGVKGDPSDAFGFESFFPSAVQPVIKVIGARVFRAFQMMNLCPRQPRGFDAASRAAYPGQNTDIHASRWRNKALQDLDSQLKNPSQPTLSAVTVHSSTSTPQQHTSVPSSSAHNNNNGGGSSSSSNGGGGRGRSPANATTPHASSQSTS